MAQRWTDGQHSAQHTEKKSAAEARACSSSAVWLCSYDRQFPLYFVRSPQSVEQEKLPQGIEASRQAMNHHDQLRIRSRSKTASRTAADGEGQRGSFGHERATSEPEHHQAKVGTSAKSEPETERKRKSEQGLPHSQANGRDGVEIARGELVAPVLFHHTERAEQHERVSWSCHHRQTHGHEGMQKQRRESEERMGMHNGGRDGGPRQRRQHKFSAHIPLRPACAS